MKSDKLIDSPFLPLVLSTGVVALLLAQRRTKSVTPVASVLARSAGAALKKPKPTSKPKAKLKAKPKATPKKKRSGTSRSYADRVAKGRPNVTFSLPAEAIAILVELAERRGLSRSAVVDLAVRELDKLDKQMRELAKCTITAKGAS